VACQPEKKPTRLTQRRSVVGSLSPKAPNGVDGATDPGAAARGLEGAARPCKAAGGVTGTALPWIALWFSHVAC
jgi:hypothetical protein